MIRASSAIGIGIATKNRWKDLRATLDHLRNEGLDQLETIVIDDGSTEPMPADFPASFSWVRFERFEKSEGNLPRRNRIAALLSTDFYLSLDDDSYPVAGDLQAAAQWLHDHPLTAALAFRIIWPDDAVPDIAQAPTPTVTRDFINCGALLRRSTFLELGGFETRLHFYHEEPEYGFRVFQNGYDIYAYPSVVVRHVVTQSARPQPDRARYFIRNLVLMDLWYYPVPEGLIRAVAHLPLIYKGRPKLRPYPFALVRGWIEGFVCYVLWGKLKLRLTPEQMAVWKARPGVHKATGSPSPR